MLLKVPVPLLRRDIGLGGLVSKATEKVGLKPCGGCKKREKTLDELLTFTSRGKRNASRRV